MIAVQLAITLTALLSVAAIALDGGVLWSEKRHAQAVADAAAMAGATDLYTNYPTYNGLDTQGTAKASALTTAAANGYSNNGTNSIVTVNIPPQSGLFAGLAGYVEVIVQYNQPRGFSNIFGSAPIPVKARAVARGAWVPPKGGIIALNPTASGAITASGQGNLTVNNGIVIDDSNSNAALTVNGGGTMTAQAFNITGSYTGNIGSPGISTTPKTGVPPTLDPFAYLPAPTPPASGTITKVALGPGQGFQYTLTPGSFGGLGQPSLPNFTSGDQVIFQQDPSGNGAIYYLTAGGLTSNGANLTMGSGSGGIMIYNAGTGQNDGISVAGSPAGTINLTGINTTNTSSPNYIYTGFLYFQARNASEDVKITGNGNFTMNGTFYAFDATLKLAGQGTTTINGSLVANQMTFAGQGNVTVNYGGFAQPRARFLGLVE
jgi:hypothetical protein